MDETSARARALNFAEIHPPLRPDEAIVESSRCLFCFDAPCTRACPTHIDIPKFIRQIRHRDTLGAARTILDANIFGGSCARICPVEILCEGACVDNTHLKAPVQIGRLQRFACDTAHDLSFDFYEPGPDSGRRVAVVGAGPAGLTCAHELRKAGHAVTVFEARDMPGGLNTYGIAAYKITTEFAVTEVERIARLGMDLRLNSPVDAAGLSRLLAEYDAVFLAVGLGRTAPLGIPGENLAGVWESLAFIFQTHTLPPEDCVVGRNVLVIGGGNTAIDAANAAVRLGAERVTVVYRRGPEAMPAFAHEIELARESGVLFEFNAMPVRILGHSGESSAPGPSGFSETTRAQSHVSGLECARTQPADPQSSGRPSRLAPVPGSEFVLPCDMVIKALGQERLLDLLSAVPGLRLDGEGRVATDPATGATSVPNLFAGGDCQSGAGEEVVIAVQAGKLAASGIDQMLRGRMRGLSPDPLQPGS